jgi:hypothetical protein
MTLTIKILFGLLIVIILSALGFIAYQEYKINQLQSNIVITQSQLNDAITRSSTQNATKDDINKLIIQEGINLSTIQNDIANLNATIMGINIIAVDSSGSNQTNVPSTSSSPNPNPPSITPICSSSDPFNYDKAQQFMALNESFADNTIVPIGQVGFSAWQQNPWSVNISPRKYNVVNVLATDEKNNNIIYNKFSVNIDGKDYPINITNASFSQQIPENHFNFWNPRLHLTAGAGVLLSGSPKASGNIAGAVALMSYGKIDSSPLLSILQIGAGYETQSQRFMGVINPVALNIGKVVGTNLISNTYAAPSFQFDTGRNMYIGLNLSLGL